MPLRIDIVTIFPDFFRGPFDFGVVKRARERAILNLTVHDLRDYTTDRHHTVDTPPVGGGGGMVMKPGPICEAVESIRTPGKSHSLILSPTGDPLTQPLLAKLAQAHQVILVCGRYEGLDARIPALLNAREISVGDFVLSGGELPACVITEGITRLLEGALGCAHSNQEESFTTGLLDYPHYAKSATYRESPVPDILRTGDHARIRRYRRKCALLATLAKRPDLLSAFRLSQEDESLLDELRDEIALEPCSDSSR